MTTKEDLLKAWLRFKEEQLNDMMSYSENDGFIEDFELTDKE